MVEEEDDGGGGGGSGGGINDDERDSVSVRHTVPQGGRTQLHHQYQPQIGPQLPVTKVAPADPPPPASEADHIPLNLACLHQSTEVAALLLEKHAKLLPDAEGLYPQHLVARSSNTDQLLLLLKMHGADLNQRDKLYSWTPLFHAASEGRVTCLRALLANGADPNALDEKGLTAMYYATWEGHLKCMDLLWESSSYTRVGRSPLVHSTVGGILTPQNQANSTDLANSTAFGEVDGIPDLSLPPPIIPLRRYGHNFLDKKTFISISFEKGPNAIQFFNEARYPAARISISCKTSDLIPRSLMLPIREDFQAVSFQIDSLEVFTVEFEIFPTFGSKVIAKSVALPDVFRAVSSSSGTCCLPLFDPRLRAVGQIQFAYQVIKPYDGTPLEITQFAPYWKATSALDDQNGLVTGSSLSGDYLSIYVQLSRDRVPVVHGNLLVQHSGLQVPVSHLTMDTIKQLAAGRKQLTEIAFTPGGTLNISSLRQTLNESILSLEDVLAITPPQLSLNIHILYPSSFEEVSLGIFSSIDINTFANAVLTCVFDHARALKARNSDLSRSIVFSSVNPYACTALNWKQPNYPILLCNDLGYTRDLLVPPYQSSIKESARLAQNNNFMGLTCSSKILSRVPALVETIRQAGLVVVSDMSEEETQSVPPARVAYAMPDGVNGIMKSTGILRFNESIDM